MISLDQIVKRTQQIPPLPDVVLKVLEVSEDPECAVKDLVEIIKLDQGITFRVLRLCNSAYFGLPRRISTLSEALVFLGNSTLVNFILTSYASDFFQKPHPGYGLEKGKMWRHAVSTALGADIIAAQVLDSDRGLMFTAGLLHDVGKIILSEFVLTDLARIHQVVTKEKCSFFEAEKAVLGFTHAEVGAQVAVAWSLPSVLVNAILYHHEPQKAREDIDEVLIVHLANVLSLLIGHGLGSDGLQAHFHEAALERFELTTDDLMTLSGRIQITFTDALELIQLSS